MPSDHPLLKKSCIIAFHELETTVEIRFNPARDVLQAIRHHSPLVSEAAIHGESIPILELLNHHEEHDVSPRLFQVKTYIAFRVTPPKQVLFSGRVPLVLLPHNRRRSAQHVRASGFGPPFGRSCVCGSLAAYIHRLVVSARFVRSYVVYGPLEDERIIVHELLQGWPELAEKHSSI